MSATLMCSKHNRKLEQVCTQCKGVDEPMCVYCFCEHLQGHGYGSIHVLLLVREQLTRIPDAIKQSQEDLLKLRKNDDAVQEQLAKHVTTQRGCEERLAAINGFYEKQRNALTSTCQNVDGSMKGLQAALGKEEQKVSENVKDPTKAQRKIEAMLSREEFMLAYRELQRIFKEDISVNDASVLAERANCERFMGDCTAQLALLDLVSLDNAEFKEMKNRGAAMTQEIATLQKEVNSLKEELVAQKKNADQKMQEIQTRYDTRAAEIQSLAQEKVAMTAELENRDKRLCESAILLSSTQQEHKAKGDERRAAKKAQEAQRITELKAKDEAIKVLQAEVAKLKKDLAAAPNSFVATPSSPVAGGQIAGLSGVTKIISDPASLKMLYDWVLESARLPVVFQLLYRGSDHGFSANTFRAFSGGKGATLTIVHANTGTIFGGYTSIPWSVQSNATHDPSAFIYSIDWKVKCGSQRNTCSIINTPTMGPMFGSGPDLAIADNCNTNNNSMCNMTAASATYCLPPGANINFPAGAPKFTVQELEVFLVFRA